MKKMDYQNVRGTQDYLPAAEVIRRNMKRTLEDVFSQYGCKPLETPILNYTDLMASKYGGGAEISEEMYTLTDRGKRDLALRYDLTIPFAKVVAMNPTLTMPFKRYEIGKVFRDGPIKAGRFREFTQCDVDIVGVDTQVAEAECMLMAVDACAKLGLPMVIHYNNRKLLTGMLACIGVEKEKQSRVILTIDKLEKIGASNVVKELHAQGLSQQVTATIEAFLQAGHSMDYFKRYAEESVDVQQGIAEIEALQSFLTSLAIEKQCVFNPFLARGLEIYTSTVYELFLEDGTITSSIGSGGRYDQAIGGLIGTDETFSTVGISFGLDVMYEAIRSTNQPASPLVDYYIVPLGRQTEALLVARELREQGYRVECEWTNKNLRKALTKANKEGVKYVIIIGEEEVEQNQYKRKDMQSGEEQRIAFRFA
ncbi:histidine--tRNA ligase [Shouchella miscanthi]|uniref:Histidine--tRNA ligase n=1 Tax=Shouchella miscanthi TaxID=2598861 RepID=A0ABU6NNQ3_9BACI|nr:histidine--tRNA ligase [Shouchella miscanthi]